MMDKAKLWMRHGERSADGPEPATEADLRTLNALANKLAEMLASKRFRLSESCDTLSGAAQMNDGKSTGETQATGLALSADSPASKPVGPDLKRRRLIRGAAGAAPVVLTLRSGSLAAAASCISAVKINLSTNSSNEIQGDTTGVLPGMHCVGDTDPTNCVGANHIQKNIGTTAGLVQNTSPLKCGTGTEGTSRNNVAILTAASWDSFTAP